VSPNMQEMALALLRQLQRTSGATRLGLMHNYSASTVTALRLWIITCRVLASCGPIAHRILSRAYATEAGVGHKVSHRIGYRIFAPGTNEEQRCRKILLDAFGRGRLLDGSGSRPAGSSSQRGASLDSGTECGR